MVCRAVLPPTGLGPLASTLISPHWVAWERPHRRRNLVSPKTIMERRTAGRPRVDVGSAFGRTGVGAAREQCRVLTTRRRSL